MPLIDNGSRRSPLGAVRESWGVSETDLIHLQLDVYMTREGPWNPDHGAIEIPDTWDFLPSGDAFVTRRVKANGVYWVAWRPRGHSRPHRRKLGLWAPRETIEAAQGEAAENEEHRAKRRAQSALARDRQEARYREELEGAIRQFLAFAPEHAHLADEITRAAAARAAEVGSGRVGRTQALPLEERAALAARAFIRHRYTSYEDDLSEAAVQDPWDEGFWYREIKADARRAIDDFLRRHRETPP